MSRFRQTGDNAYLVDEDIDGTIATSKGYSDSVGIFELSVPCIICGELVKIDRWDSQPKVCDKCRKAIMKMRETF